MCVCNATRSFVKRGSRPSNRATVELRPSAATSTRARKAVAVSVVVNFQALSDFSIDVSVLASRISAPSLRARSSSTESNALRLTATSKSSIRFHFRGMRTGIKRFPQCDPDGVMECWSIEAQVTQLPITDCSKGVGARYLDEDVWLPMSWSLPIFRIAGIQLRIHITFLLLIAWLAFGYYAEGGSAVALGRVLFVLLLFVCVVLHEFGHAIAAKNFGIDTPDITLLPIGGVARLQRMPDEPRQELIIALAGPLVNVVIAFTLFAVVGWRGLAAQAAMGGPDLLAQLLVINVVLVLFNLLPAFPMDGGRVLRALLATRLSYTRATQLAASIGQG